MQAYLHGTFTREVNDLVNAQRANSGVSKTEISPICADWDTEVAAFATAHCQAAIPRSKATGN
jgi:putative transposase